MKYNFFWHEVRIPRTKSEIEANYKRKQLMKHFNDKVRVETISTVMNTEKRQREERASTH